MNVIYTVLRIDPFKAGFNVHINSFFLSAFQSSQNVTANPQQNKNTLNIKEDLFKLWTTTL